ncbi:TetR family transcriptional regulator [Frondihabitans sp. PhB188]|uniref:TetR/AcrR family transcriptional regulator n=1 Tax=Frondihabitans sp. PhB188 TaxID=2485200 RepID=UPI000F4A0ECE|nr:TetR/AcrR family transcriptional regulator [Frondihabitans sp. PhB188]ROQ41236.1 TetR family transcriptional regulator [Frondihabitans sp. PhB188]
MSPSETGVRARARAETTARALAVANRQLGEVGPAALSVRSIARELGISSSAIYRYFPSRDALLTRLIIDAYTDLGAAAAEAAAVPAGAPRFRAIARAARSWSLDNPHRFALLYGTPVPGYDAPADTTGPALTVAYLLLDALLASPDVVWPPVDERLRPGFEELASVLSPARSSLPAGSSSMAGPSSSTGSSSVDAPAESIAAGVAIWTALFGRLSFEVLGQYTNVVADRDAWFEAFLDEELGRVGLR